MDNTITYRKIIIIACISSIILGVFLHFAYDTLGNNTLVGIFAPVNESVWEHLKLILIPFTTFGVIFYFYTKQKFSNIFLATLFGNVMGMFVVTTLYYLGKAMFTTENMIYNIAIYVLGMIAAYSVIYFSVYNKEFLEETKDSSAIGVCALALLFTIFIINTFFPIKLDLTRDPINKTYGIHKLV